MAAMLKPGAAAAMGAAGYAHVMARFSRHAFTTALEGMCYELAAPAGKRKAA